MSKCKEVESEEGITDFEFSDREEDPASEMKSKAKEFAEEVIKEIDAPAEEEDREGGRIALTCKV